MSPATTGTARRWIVLSTASLAVFMFFLDATIVNIGFPALRDAFRSSSTEALSWVLNAYAIVFAALLVAAGLRADRVGRRATFLTGVAVFTGASALCGLAPNVGLLIAGRALQAAGGALLVPSALGLVLPEFGVHERGTAVGIWSAVAAVAAAIGPTLGSGIIELGDWRWMFFVNVPIGIGTIFLGRRVLRESKDPSARRPDAAGVIGLGIGMAALALGIVQGGDWGWSDPKVVGSFVLGVALIAAVVARSNTHPSPVLDVALFRVRSFAAANVASLFFAVGFYASMLNGVLFLTGVWGYSLLRAGLAITPGPLTAAVAAGIGGRLADRRGYRAVIVPGCLLSVAGSIWLFSVVETSPAYLAVWLPAQILMGAGIGFGFATLGGAAVSSLPPANFGVGSAILSTFRQFGGAIGVAALIAVLGTPQPGEVLAAFDRAFLLVGAAILMSGLVSAAIQKPKHISLGEHAPAGVVPEVVAGS